MYGGTWHLLHCISCRLASFSPQLHFSTPEMADSSSKIKAPSAKIYDIPATKVWSLLEVNRKAKNEIDRKIRAVWDTHLKDQEDQFSKLPKDLLDKATEELVRELPEIFDKCDGTWFATWAFFNRHKGRFRESVRRQSTTQAEGVGNDPNHPQETFSNSHLHITSNHLLSFAALGIREFSFISVLIHIIHVSPTRHYMVQNINHRQEFYSLTG
ncbi:hypothetical protein L873DRAFT_762722 [Choiromyces venosus 120613-1]|uniref:Uncharacterized protein n=1 Tax=Choiromyces venosus 120613-1 TaxID=1336337 RepID=A0A3N4JR87_9PEZI|nr:hypothetical protein L873DRAFT_762722 [Choiromyces venosus 120613-1]